MYMRATGASELRIFSHFHILKLLFPSLQYFVGTSDTLSQEHNISGLKIHKLHTYIINVVPFYYLWYGAICKRQYTDKTLTLKKSMYMRASLEYFCIFKF